MRVGQRRVELRLQMAQLSGQTGPHMVYRKGELSLATIDREWPHQLALSAEYLRGNNCIIVERFCRGLSVCSRNRKYWRDGKEHLLLHHARRGRVRSGALWRRVR
jgi:hypothetical protein